MSDNNLQFQSIYLRDGNAPFFIPGRGGSADNLVKGDRVLRTGFGEEGNISLDCFWSLLPQSSSVSLIGAPSFFDFSFFPFFFDFDPFFCLLVFFVPGKK